VHHSSDADLVQNAQRGDVDAVGELYDRHHERIFRYVWARVRDRGTAEDLTGDVFTRMVTHLGGYQVGSVPFVAWLYRIAHNLIIDHYRKEKATMSVPLHYADGVSQSQDNPTTVVERQLTLEKIHHALTTIDQTQQEVVILRFLVGLSLNEVAHTVDKSVAAVKALQHRGLSALRLALKQE
jgi:RNA polymerase sigma-70 factor, ECF subfamily